jgi:hypothetical protein
MLLIFPNVTTDNMEAVPPMGTPVIYYENKSYARQKNTRYKNIKK